MAALALHLDVAEELRMEPRISLITLGVADLQRSLRFYRDGLGLPTTWTGDRGVVFFQTAGTALSLYPYDKLAEDVSPEFLVQRSKFSGIALAHNVREKSEVDTVLAQAVAAGARLEKPAQENFWGGYSGYFSDPDGYLWEIAWGAFPFRADGSLDIP
jgi:catechol 2,3-dioxygenase-like lactoylglutathione lyase family enzyme